MGMLWDLIEKFRKDKGWTGRELARRLEVTSSTPGNWANPKSLVKREHLYAINEVTGIPYGKLLAANLYDIDYLGKDRRQPMPDEFDPDSLIAGGASVLPFPTKIPPEIHERAALDHGTPSEGARLAEESDRNEGV